VSVAAKKNPYVFQNNVQSVRVSLKKPEGEAVWRCSNPSCPAQIAQRIIHFAARKAADIEGLGSKNVALLLENELVTDIASLYDLRLEQLEALPRMGEVSSQNLLDALEESKKLALERFIFGLGIRHVGERTAFILAQYCGDMSRFLQLRPAELLEINEIGAGTAEAIETFLNDPDERQMLVSLLEHGFELEAPQALEAGGALEGKTVVLTGTLQSMSRGAAKKKIQALAGKVSSSVIVRVTRLDPGSGISIVAPRCLAKGSFSIYSRIFCCLSFSIRFGS